MNTMRQPGSDRVHPLPRLKGQSHDLRRILLQLLTAPSSTGTSTPEPFLNNLSSGYQWWNQVDSTSSSDNEANSGDAYNEFTDEDFLELLEIPDPDQYVPAFDLNSDFGIP
jgi:hypothetical protein